MSDIDCRYVKSYFAFPTAFTSQTNCPPPRMTSRNYVSLSTGAARHGAVVLVRVNLLAGNGLAGDKVCHWRFQARPLGSSSSGAAIRQIRIALPSLRIVSPSTTPALRT